MKKSGTSKSDRMKGGNKQEVKPLMSFDVVYTVLCGYARSITSFDACCYFSKMSHSRTVSPDVSFLHTQQISRLHLTQVGLLCAFVLYAVFVQDSIPVLFCKCGIFVSNWEMLI